VQRNGIATTLHLPQTQPQVLIHPSRTALMLAAALVSQGLTPAAAQPLLTRLQALPQAQRQAAEQVLVALLG